MSATGQFHLQWRGQRFGPWDLAAIREALKSGTIHSLYQIHAGGQWQPLRDFLESQPSPVTVKKPREVPKPPEETVDSQPSEESQATQPPRDVASTQKLELGGSIPPPLPVRPLILPADYMTPPAYHQQPGSVFIRTNGLAVACLVLSLCFWIPFVNIISWILSMIFGHIALVQISFQPGLGGRGLALTGLGISYALMIFTLIEIFLKPFFLLQP